MAYEKVGVDREYKDSGEYVIVLGTRRGRLRIRVSRQSARDKLFRQLKRLVRESEKEVRAFSKEESGDMVDDYELESKIGDEAHSYQVAFDSFSELVLPDPTKSI